MDISIIVPVYNSQKYLNRCIDSVIKTLRFSRKTGEILLIDNNSTDDSMKILEKYAHKYPKVITVLSCKTQGAAATRNYGVSQARGKYIWFIDADDSVAEESVRELVDQAEQEKADLTMLGLSRVYTDGHSEYIPPIMPDDPNYKSKFIRSELGQVQVLIKRSWWNQNKFRFKEGIIHEDMELLPSIILYTDKYTAINKLFYYYYQNDDSVLHKTKWDPHYYDIYVALESLYQRFDKADATDTYHDELEWFTIWNLLVDSAKFFAKFKEGRAGFKKTRQFLKNHYPNWRKNRFLNQKKISWKFRLWLNLSYLGIVK